MAFTIATLAFLIGAAISLRFNVLILVLTIGGAIVGAATIGIAHGNGLRSIALTVMIVAVALQAGYFVGIVARGVLGSVLRTRRVPARHIAAPT